MDVVGFLTHAKSLIDSPEKWTQKAYARSVSGMPCDGGRGVCFCSVGALWRTQDDLRSEREVRWGASDVLRDVVLDGSTNTSIVDFNDSHTHAEVMALFDEAIERAKATKNG